MFGNNSTIVTLNIESDSARLLAVKGGKIEYWKSVPLTADSVKATTIANVQAVAAALTHFMFKSTEIPNNKMIVSMTGLRSVYRIVPLPKIKPSQIEEAIRWIAMREIPFDLKDLHLFWQILGENDEEQKVFLIATPKSMLEVIETTLSKANIKPKALDLKPLALARFVNNPNAIILDMEADSNSIVVMKKGLPQVMNTLVVQQNNQTLRDRALRLSSDLARTVMFYNNVHEDDPITPSTQAFLTGKLGTDEHMMELLKTAIEYPIAAPSLCLEHPNDFPVSQYAVNIGLALKEKSLVKQNKDVAVGYCPVNINILPSIN